MGSGDREEVKVQVNVRLPYQDAGVGLVIVGRVHTVEPLLAGRVPEVCRGRELHVSSFDIRCDRLKLLPY